MRVKERKRERNKHTKRKREAVNEKEINNVIQIAKENFAKIKYLIIEKEHDEDRDKAGPCVVIKYCII